MSFLIFLIHFCTFLSRFYYVLPILQCNVHKINKTLNMYLQPKMNWFLKNIYVYHENKLIKEFIISLF